MERGGKRACASNLYDCGASKGQAECQHANALAMPALSALAPQLFREDLPLYPPRIALGLGCFAFLPFCQCVKCRISAQRPPAAYHTRKRLGLVAGLHSWKLSDRILERFHIDRLFQDTDMGLPAMMPMVSKGCVTSRT